MRVVREDPGRKGLLFAGTEPGMFVSFDDVADWQPLQLNLPPAPITDLTFRWFVTAGEDDCGSSLS